MQPIITDIKYVAPCWLIRGALQFFSCHTLDNLETNEYSNRMQMKTVLAAVAIMLIAFVQALLCSQLNVLYSWLICSGCALACTMLGMFIAKQGLLNMLKNELTKVAHFPGGNTK